jgi:uncharacterized membrane protein YphA (DoxX/SURF4 family)
MTTQFDRVDRAIVRWMSDNGVTALRLSLGIVFLWFGVLKYFPHMSPAETLASDTIRVLSFGHIGPHVSLPILATWECLIGIGLISGVAKRATLFLLFAQMLGTLLPLFFFPARTFAIVPFVPTLEGQYIIKNLVLISAGIVIGATLRGGASHDRV